MVVVSCKICIFAGRKPEILILMKKLIFTAIVAALVSAACTHRSEPTVLLPSYFTDSMVVQQQSAMIIKGKAADDVCVEASWTDEKFDAALAIDSSFSIEIPTPVAGGPYTLTISDGVGPDRVLRDVYSGEVWLCSGQSNMEMPVGDWGRVLNYKAEMDTAVNFPLIRLLKVRRAISPELQEDAVMAMGGWRPASPKTVEKFSAIGYFFARDIQRELGDVPVGIIDCTWGGTVAEAWTSLGALREMGDFDEALEIVEAAAADTAAVMKAYREEMEAWTDLVAASNPEFDWAEYQKSWKKMPVPGRWEDSVLPGFDGIVWMQYCVDIPDNWAGKKLKLNLGEIDDYDTTYFNGDTVGQSFQYNMPREYTVPAELVESGQAVITVRVWDDTSSGGFWGKPEDMFIACGKEKISLTGEWAYLPVMDFREHPMPKVPYDHNTPTMLYNAMLYPLRDIAVQGVLWYQGCSNVGRAEQYSRLFPAMIRNWRSTFKRDDMPFYFVQLAAFLEPKAVQPDSEWAALRAAQTAAMQLENVAMTSAIDIGDPYDIHPKNKQEVARRLALIALNRNYGREDVAYEAPVSEKVDFQGNKVVIKFNGEIVADGDVRGFIVRTAAGWAQAKAAITAPDEITLTAPGIATAIKYDWADYPDGNLYSPDKLPVLPFEREK